ncbi:MAG: GNAT family N-acetyltransferase, partial [Acidimicrobiales bacterium]
MKPAANPVATEAVLVDVPRSESQWAAGTGLLAAYFDWLAPLAGVESVPAVQPAARDELADLAGVYRRPRHRFLLGTQGRLPVGIVGLRPEAEPEVVELVRFYSRPAARGAGVGTAVLSAAVAAAVDLGFE